MLVEIEALGQDGDGIAPTDKGPVFVPYTAPGDRARISLIETRAGAARRGVLREVLSPAAGRQTPPCVHFTRCGGCRVQHLAPELYRRWKYGLLEAALDRARALPEERRAMIGVPPGTRRRARLHVRHLPDGIRLGFHEALSRRIVDLDECTILHPDLLDLLPPLRSVLATILARGHQLDISLTRLDDGVDLVLHGLARPKLDVIERLTDFAHRTGLARLSAGPPDGPVEPVANLAPGHLTIGPARIVPPPAPFLQATREGEEALAAAVLAALAGCPTGAKVADLFCGIGTFSLRLAARHPVLALDGDSAAIAALDAAGRQAGLAYELTAKTRDLGQRPLEGDELAGLGAVVFDPPRAGAPAQAAALARSRVPVVVAVSCNPKTFARDARILMDGGYRFAHVQPIDQFLWTAHLEIIGVFLNER